MDQNELIAELLQAVTNDVQQLKQWSQKVPTTTPPDYRAQLDRLSLSIDQLRQQVAQPVTQSVKVDTSPIKEQLDRLEMAIKAKPDYRISQAVKYGSWAFGIIVILLAIATTLAWQYRQERDQWESGQAWAMWRLRYIEQADPKFYNFVQAQFDKDPKAVGEWIVKQEEADAKREAAKKAHEQAQAMNAQADQLEGKKKDRKRS